MAAMQYQDILQNKRYLFWALQLAGWSGWAISFYLGVVLRDKPLENYGLYLATIAFIGMLLTLGLRWLYRTIWDKSITVRVVAILGGSYAAAVLWMLSRSTIFSNIYPDQTKSYAEMGEWTFLSYFAGASLAFWVMLVWSALYFGIKYYLMMQEERQRSLKAMNMAHEAQLKMLRYQLNPHFLFNTLNAISTLILDGNNKLANVMVTRLSRFLRYSLDNDPMLRVTVAEEVEALQLYLDIEKVRFEERLRLHFSISPEASDALMPSLLLQPLVENSIKYAIANAIAGGSIAVSADIIGGELELVVADDGPGLDLRNGRMPKGGGVGLANIRERLREVYGEKQSFRLGATEPHGLTITIRIPLEHATTTA